MAPICAEIGVRRVFAHHNWCSNCSNYPTSDYISHPTKPTTGELCDQCKAKRDADNCK
jgi:ssDNA-binding Zn-finger/Zn-ribbon topoisomerase 1